MLSCFFPNDRVAAYSASRFKTRIDLIGQHLIQQRYLPATTAKHVREWLRFAAYLERRRLALPLEIRGAEVQAYVTHRKHTCRSVSRAQFVRASVRIFLEADEQGQFRRRVANVPASVPPWLAASLDQYVTWLRAHRGSAPSTIAKQVWQLTRFAERVEQFGVTSLAVIVPRHLQGFLSGLSALAPLTRRQYATALRSFFGWAYTTERVPVDLRPAVMAPRSFKQRSIRDVVTDGELASILKAVDRSSVIGRRDYAVLILAARYGLRPCDIRQLRLDALHWRDGILSIEQAKTGRPLTLPMLPEVAEALVAYLREGRPASTSRHVFVRHRAPFEPFASGNDLATIMRRALQRVGLDQRAGRRGLYLFRHTLASQMLSAGCPIKSIGDVLGHASTDTTMEYASIDLTALRRVSLSEEEVRA
jgi:integrase